MTLASLIYAQSQGITCKGPDECHWCSCPCERVHPHDEAPPLLGFKRSSFAKRPGNGYICEACRYWRRGPMTVDTLGGTYKDRQRMITNQWLVTPESAVCIVKGQSEIPLYKTLFNPPHKFFLALSTQDKIETHLHCCIGNDNDELLAETPLHFTLDNKPLQYTVYELELGLRGQETGLEPGVYSLIRLLGPYTPEMTLSSRKPTGRPQTEQIPDNRKVISNKKK